jgi:hypothetical protein
MLRIPVKARSLGLPVNATVTLVLLQRSFADAPGWIWGVLWTLMVILWCVALADVYTSTPISDAEWERVFPDGNSKRTR